MTTFKEEWNLEMALEVMRHKTVDSRLWADAVKWLLLYGPPEIREVLEQAALVATNQEFPDLTPTGFNDKGEPCYDVDSLARALQIPTEEAVDLLGSVEEEHGESLLFNASDTKKIQ